MKIIDITFDGFRIKKGKSKMDMLAINDFLSKYSGWSDGMYDQLYKLPSWIYL